jgi:hypothetical protein
METNYWKQKYENQIQYTNKLANGMEYQDKVCIELSKYNIILQNINSKIFQYEIGENLQGFEIKQDKTSLKTNRYSIEIAEKTNGNNINWINSGIFRNDNSFIYIQGNEKFFHMFSKSFLINIYKTNKYKTYEYPKELPTVKKWYLDFVDADKYCIKKFIFTT